MEMSWAFQGSPIEHSKDPSITIIRVNKHLTTLSVEGVSARHAGEYSCTAANVAGSVSRSTVLTVNGTKFIHVFGYNYVLCISFDP